MPVHLTSWSCRAGSASCVLLQPGMLFQHHGRTSPNVNACSSPLTCQCTSELAACECQIGNHKGVWAEFCDQEYLSHDPSTCEKASFSLVWDTPTRGGIDAALAGGVSAQGLVSGFDAANRADAGKAAEQGVDGKCASCTPHCQLQQALSRKDRLLWSLLPIDLHSANLGGY